MRTRRVCLVDAVRGSGSRGCDLELWSPERITPERELLERMRAFRREVYAEFGFLSCGADEDAPGAQGSPRRGGVLAADVADEADLRAWHLLAFRRDSRALAGCIRFIAFPVSRAAEVPESVLGHSGCGFSASDRRRCLAALREYCEEWSRWEGPFVQIGGLAVDAEARRSALGPLLCLAGNAFMRCVDSRFGVIFGSEKTSAGGRLYAKAGCFLLPFEGEPLPPLPDRFHRDHALVMGADPATVRPTLQADVEELCAGFRGLHEEELRACADGEKEWQEKESEE